MDQTVVQYNDAAALEMRGKSIILERQSAAFVLRMLRSTLIKIAARTGQRV